MDMDKVDFSKAAAETVNGLLELYRIGVDDGRKQLKAENERLKKAIVLLNSMVLGVEKHSAKSKALVEQALKEEPNEESRNG